MRLRVAFASAAHGNTARRFLAAAQIPLAVSEPTGGDGGQLATIDIELQPGDVDRVRTLVEGVHGMVLSIERTAAAAI